jgi:hypothetical protein
MSVWDDLVDDIESIPVVGDVVQVAAKAESYIVDGVEVAGKAVVDGVELVAKTIAGGVSSYLSKANFWTEIGAIVGAGVCLFVAPEFFWGDLVFGGLAGAALGSIPDNMIAVRQLSFEEIRFTRRVFGNSLQYDRILLSDGAGLGGRAFTTPSLNPFSQQIVIHLPHECFYNPLIYTNSVYPRAGQVYIHELTHAWQIIYNHFTPGVICDGISTQLKQMLFNVDVYALDTTELKPYRTWNCEQQAHLVDLWFQGGSSQLNRLFPYIRDNIWPGSLSNPATHSYMTTLSCCEHCSAVFLTDLQTGVCPARKGRPHVAGASFMVQRFDSMPSDLTHEVMAFTRGWTTCLTCGAFCRLYGQPVARDCCPSRTGGHPNGEHAVMWGSPEFVVKFLGDQSLVRDEYQAFQSFNYWKGWRECRKCRALYTKDVGGENNVCPFDSQPHAPAATFDYVLENSYGS